MNPSIVARGVRAFLGLSLLGFLAPATAGQARSWVHPDGTTHWYRAVIAPQGIGWTEANAAAAAAGGYLATITSAEESQFVFQLVDRPELWALDAAAARVHGPWLGGLRQPTSHEMTGSWVWAELEPMSHTAWAAGQPSDAIADDRICFAAPAGRAPTWASVPESTQLLGYVIEHSGPMVPRTLGVLRREPASFDGYTLYSPFSSTQTHLVDAQGRVVNAWTSQHPPGTGAYLLPNGNLLRSGNLINPNFCCGCGGVVEEFDWQGKVVWAYTLSTNKSVLHHDVARLPNGNTLMLVWDIKTRDECLAAGRSPRLLRDGLVWSERVIEVDALGRIVWQWNVWDHLVQDVDASKAHYGDVAKHPELVDVNFGLDVGQADWLHANAVTYNAKLDQIMISVRHFDELWVVDHSTTMAEAAGHAGGRSGKGGDLLYRWGNPRAYRAGTAQDQRLFQQHDCHWIPDGLPGAGNILVFNNGGGRPGGNATTVDEIVPPRVDAQGNYERAGQAFGPSRPIWSYPRQPDPGFFSQYVGSAQRLPNGNTLIGAGWNGMSVEVATTGETVWEYRLPIRGIGGLIAWQGDELTGNDTGRFFRSPRYAPDFAGLRGKQLTAGEVIERYKVGLLADGTTLGQAVALNARVELSVHSLDDAGRFYLLGTSMTSGSMAIDHRVLRAGPDELLILSATGAFPTVFQGYAGVFDGSGRARATFTIPSIAGLVGLSFHTTFLVVDPSARSAIRTISNTVVTRVL